MEEAITDQIIKTTQNLIGPPIEEFEMDPENEIINICP